MARAGEVKAGDTVLEVGPGKGALTKILLATGAKVIVVEKDTELISYLKEKFSDLSAGALNGITRNTVFHIAKDLGLEIVQKRITRDEVYISDEAFFTGTAAEVTPIRELDRIEIGDGSRGPITEKIQSGFFDIVNGRNAKYMHWLSKV